MQRVMKPTRKLRPRSFVAQVAGVGPLGGTVTAQTGGGREEALNDRDLAHPARGGTAQDHDN